MRLIDADKLCEDLLERWSIADTRKEELIRLVMADIVTPIIVSQPSAEPERKKGKWIPDEIAAYDMPKGEPRGWVPWLCSECGWCVGKHQTAFCPSCGADMRG